MAQSIRQKQKESPTIQFKAEDKKALIESVKGLTLENSQKVISQTLDLEVKCFEKQKIQSDESIRLEMTLTKEQNELLKKVKSLMSHVNPNATIADVFEYLAKDYLKRKDPLIKATQKQKNASTENSGNIQNTNLNATTCKTKVENSVISQTFIKDSAIVCTQHIAVKNSYDRKSTSATEVPARQISKSQLINALKKRKAISVSIKRAVWQRDHGQCQHKNQTTGKLCGSNHLLEFDHIKRFSHGGEDSAQNLRLLCKAHNLWRG